MKSSTFPRLIGTVVLTALVALVSATSTEAQAGFPGGTYSQNFDTLASSATSSTVPEGWAFSEAETNANTTYTAGTGSSSTGDTYSFGAIGSTERAFGGLQSGSLIPTIGVQFQNNTGRTLGSLNISYVCEQWRLGNTGRTDQLDFQYSTNATSLTTGTWVDFDGLDCVGPISSGAAGALNGNAAQNQVSLSQTVTGLNITDGATFWFRWNDFNATGADDGLAVDDISMIAQSTTAVTLGGLSASTLSGSLAMLPMLSLLAAGGLIACRRRK